MSVKAQCTLQSLEVATSERETEDRALIGDEINPKETKTEAGLGARPPHCSGDKA